MVIIDIGTYESRFGFAGDESFQILSMTIFISLSTLNTIFARNRILACWLVYILRVFLGHSLAVRPPWSLVRREVRRRSQRHHALCCPFISAHYSFPGAFKIGHLSFVLSSFTMMRLNLFIHVFFAVIPLGVC